MGREQLDVYEYALHFGGDYELLLTISPDKFEKALRSIKKVGGCLSNIGRVTQGRKISVIDCGIKKLLDNKGYEHFKRRYLH